MSKVKIVTDSTLDISDEILRQYNIEVVSLSVNIEGESFLDRVEITPSQFLEKLKQSKELPKTSQPAVGKFVDVYNRLGADGSEVLSIHMTEGMSGTVASAKSAAEMADAKVTVVDSRFISLALSFQVIEAAKMAEQGKSVNEIVEKLDKVREATSLYLMVDTLEYLAKGGRIGRGKALLGSILNVKPIASLADGVYTPVTKVRTYNKMITYFRNMFEKETEGRTVKAIGIVHVDAYDLASRLKAELEKLTSVEVTLSETTPVISTHTGPGALALMYYSE
ncbi:DegV family protein [Desertibacillus haloalkaliphilus]|uniref:DegV family protein n=1 Tax=Desertibacillus haloalkaliphilus TaxID=1328930 RepID=UPI001C27FA98|nr:DegV family protein [Desertibacillus haloalkaliphilus]MBU8905366.1 DegV family protein [Desertibacillus haloalkaliphilus]